MPLVLSRNDGPYETTILELAHGGRRPFWWSVIDKRDQRRRVGRATSDAYARHDARSALDELRALRDPASSDAYALHDARKAVDVLRRQAREEQAA